jgi:hypothetical protein
LLEERKAQPTPARSAADEQLLRKLKHQLGNVYDMLNRYASAEVYLVYSHLSGMSHTSIETANAYLEWTGGGIFEIRDEAADPGLWSTWPRPPLRRAHPRSGHDRFTLAARQRGLGGTDAGH